ncbi:molybdopterin oxidoreductase [Chitinophaga agrisoli]|uniref:Molybdopterin oxidoreductase n=1 Tax=Chitinophaga agrisoli TaxID=2607653 RepID=A0A5B2VM12_9BACT|nr:molybdopterin oxidoreductase [Chitinophaga agrisoli]KAA2239352.1 molybdopterin oxidoreductase [Chitinophaga agrisoli]
MHIGKYISLVHRTEIDLVKAFRLVADAHRDEVDVYQICMLLSSWSQSLSDDVQIFAEKYGEENDDEPDRLTQTLLKKARKGGMALLRDLHDLYLIVSEAEVCCAILQQGAAGLRDDALMLTCEEIERQSKRQLSWIYTRMRSAAPQTLIAAG